MVVAATDLHGRLISWYDAHERELPWRRPDVSAWGVLVSEVMAQQTPVDRVAPLWIEWMNRCARFGIFMGEKSFWNQGYGTEATRLMLKHAFETLNLNRIFLHVYETNPRAIRAYEKVGFVKEGLLRDAIY